MAKLFSMLEVHLRTKSCIIIVSTSLDDNIERHLTQLKEKIIQLIELISWLATPSTQVSTTLKTNFSPTFGGNK